MKDVIKFRNLNVGDEFDFSAGEYQSFFDTCIKIAPRRYQSLVTLTTYRIGSHNALVVRLGHDSSSDF